MRRACIASSWVTMRWPRHNAFENQSQQIIESRDVLFKELNMEVIHRCETPPNITTVHHNIMVHLSAIIFVMLVLSVQQPRGGASAPQEMWAVQLPVKAIGANPKSLQQIISLDTINFGDDCEHGHTNFVSWVTSLTPLTLEMIVSMSHHFCIMGWHPSNDQQQWNLCSSSWSNHLHYYPSHVEHITLKGDVQGGHGTRLQNPRAHFGECLVTVSTLWLKNGAHIFQDLPKGRKAVCSKRVCKIKLIADDIVTHFKVQLVAKGFT
jgi:hypothetical protein